MRTNLVQTLKVSAKRFNLNRTTRRVALIGLFISIAIGNAWAHGTHYGKAVLNNATGNGTVYLSTASGSNSGQTGTTGTAGAAGSTSYITWDCGGSSGNDSKTYYARGTANDGYYFAGYATSSTATSYTASTTGWSPTKASSTSSGSPTTSTIYGFFKPVTVTAAPSNVNINATDPLATYPDAGGAVLSFTTANSNKIGDFTTSSSGDAHFVIADWARASASSATFNYKFVGNGSYGETDRTFTKTVTLTSKGDASTRSCTLTAKYPNPKVVSGDDSDEYTNIFTAFAAAGDQEAVTKTAVFDVVYADDGNNFTAAFSGVTGGGAWTVTGITVDQNNQKATVTYTFNGNKAEGTHTALLTLSAKDCNGWNDTEADGSASASVTITATNEQEATNDVSVTTAAGVTTEYATWAAGLTAANASAGSTLKLLRDIDLTGTYGITGTQGITQTMTLDLNGKTLSGAINGSILNPKTAGKTLTIKDSKTGGRIQNITPDYNGITYGVNISAGTVNLESGTIYAENQKQYNYGTSSVGGTASNATAVEVRAVRLVAGAKFNMSGGKVEAHGTRAVRAIYQESSKANTTEVNISGGEVYAEAPSYVYGILAYGKVNISGTAQINVKINDGLVNGNATYQSSKFDSYTLHRYGYAIYMTASANKTPSECYFGTLTMTGGTINVENVNKTLNGTSLNTEHTYGIYMGIASTGMGNANGEATDGTNTQKASSIGSIENATINVTHAGVQVYGIDVLGSYNSFNNTTTPFTIKNSTINVTAWQTVYGALADVSIDWSNDLTTYTGTGRCSAGNIELTNTTINATTTGGTGAYCAWASATYGTVADAKANTGARSTGNATYKGEYAAAATLTVNSGTYTASAATSTAYAVGSSDRAKTIRNIRGSISNRDAVEDPVGSLGGNAEAYPELNIHGGNFSATTGTTTAIAVKSGGNTLIDGGTFNAYAGGSTAYGLYVTAGKTVANGVTFPASATTVAYGVYVFAAISDWSLFPYAGEVELNNCNATATARTTTDARGVYVYGLSKVYTQASFDAMKTANNSNYKNYGDYAQVGERSIVGKATINGGTYSATAETTTAYGIYVMSTRVSTNKEAIAYNPLVLKNATVTAKTNTGTTAYGVQPGAGGLIENCTITATAGTTTASGVRAIDKTTVIKNSTISAKGTDAVYGLEGYVEASTAHGYCWHGDFDLSEAGTTKVTAESTASSKTAYTIYLNAKAVNIASGNFAGDYATAANATINGGTYIAKTNGGTSGYTLALTGQKTSGSAVAQPEVLIEDGKFNGSTAEVGTAGVVGHVQLKGGYYVHNTNLATYIPEGYEAFPLPEERPEYTAGYRYAIEEAGNHGIYVCQIGSTKYKSLEEALQVVGNNQVIYMIANYTMTTPGDYILPSGATLLIPYKTGSGAGATTAIGNSAKTNSSATTPSLFRKLTFGAGVNLTCFGTIETSAEQRCNGQYGACAGMPSGAYGQIHMEEGSHISLEANSRLNCWGYITGKGTINVKKNATVLEDFQLGDWPGGTNASNLEGNSQKVFPITHYFYQNIECPITYRPGCRALGSTHIYASSTVAGQDAVALVGTSGSMFLMDDNDVSAETWVMKDYDEETDQCIWTINSGASIGNLNIKMSAGWISYDFSSSAYDLPITTNMSIVLNYGEMGITQNTVFLPGSELVINKQGTANINGVYVVAYDVADWTGTTRYFATYSPTWGTTNPRKNIAVKSADFFLHGKVNITNNGGLYTTASGANIHSTNADAGEVIYTTAAQGNKTNHYYLQQGGTTKTNITIYPAKLKNTDGSYASSAGTASGKTWTFKNDVWDAWGKDGCFFVNAQDEPHAKPAALVQLTSKTPDANHLHHDAATGARNFVWDADCYWWEVSTTPTPEGYYQSLNADNNGKYNYYYYNSSAGCWMIKTITVTWSINGNNTNYTVGYGTKPHWLGATPTKSSSSSDYVWRWDGWTVGSDPTVLGNEELPYVTANTTFTAHFYEKYYQSLVTFKNDDGTVLDSKLWNRGSIPSYEGTPTKEATAAQTFEFNGNWSPAITAVGSSAVEYVAQYTATTRQYNVEFVNYDMSPLGSILVDYNATPTTATYKAAIAPSDFEPYKPDNSAYSFEFAGWRLNGAEENGFAQVKGDQTYVAQFAETTKKYRITFVDEDGETVLHWTQLEYDAMPSYDGPATSGFNKQDTEWDYIFTGWDPAEFTQVKGPQTYTATYNKTHRKYTITWIDGNGATLTTTNVDYGTTPTYPGTPTPTKASTAEHSYEFNGTWSPALAPVTGPATYTAQFNETPRTYALTIGVNNAEYGSVNHDYVSGIPYNASVTVNGNSFTVNETTVTATPSDATAQYTYAFSSWSNVPNNVTDDVSNIQAVFTRTENKYTVSFNANGHGIAPSDITNVTYNTTISAPTAPTADGWIFEGWYKEFGCTNAWNFESDKVTEETTLYAKWTKDVVVDIVDWTNSTLTINANGLKTEGGTTDWKIYVVGKEGKNDYVKGDRDASRTLTIDNLALTSGNTISIQMKRGDGTVESQHHYKIPYINTATGAGAEDIVYVNSGKLTINASTTLAALYVGPEASVEITNGTLTVDKLVLRTLPWQAASISGNFTATNVYYTRIAPNLSTQDGLSGTYTYKSANYYPFALPISCDINDVFLSEGTNMASTYGSAWSLKQYNEMTRAQNGENGKNWNVVNKSDDPELPEIVGGKGYLFYSNTNYYREFYFPVNLNKKTTSVAVSYTTEDTQGASQQGWNMICSPLMENHDANPQPENPILCWLDENNDYQQMMPDEVKPAQPFFYQAVSGSPLYFDGSGTPSLAPRRRVAVAEEQTRIQWIHLDVKDSNGEGDQASIYSHPTRYEQNYKTGIDVAKQSLTATRARLYSSHAYGEMAFAGVADSLLETGVALTVYSPSAQELTFSLRENDWLNRMEYVWLIDVETGMQINLLNSDYTFDAAEGTTRGRFFIRGQFKAPQVTTDIQNGAGIEEGARKVLIDQKIYIEVNGRLYDATGKIVSK